MNNLISIIIPTFNNEKQIKTCIDSVLKQTYELLEIIIINDGSTDNTLDILQKYDDKRIIIYTTKNGGVSKARNIGLEKANGDYIGFVDADDRIDYEMFEHLMNNLIKFNADISHCGFQLEMPQRTIHFHATGKILLQNKIEGLEGLLTSLYFEPSTWNKLYKRNIIRDIRFDESISINEDLLFNFEAFQRSNKTVFEDKTFYHYQHNPKSAARSGFNTNKLIDQLTVAHKIKASKYPSELSKIINRYYIQKNINVFKILKNKGMTKTKCMKLVTDNLKYSSSKGLSLRLIIIKYCIKYFPSIFYKIFQIYNQYIGKIQKWYIPEYE